MKHYKNIVLHDLLFSSHADNFVIVDMLKLFVATLWFRPDWQVLDGMDSLEYVVK